MRKELTKYEIVLADFTGAIMATIWEDTIPHVCDQKSYLWSNFKVGFFRRKCLNGTKDCRLAATDESDGQFVECSACKLRMLKENLDSTVSGSVIIVDDSGENLGRFLLVILCNNCVYIMYI